MVFENNNKISIYLNLFLSRKPWLNFDDVTIYKKNYKHTHTHRNMSNKLSEIRKVVRGRDKENNTLENFFLFSLVQNWIRKKWYVKK
jgi:hypothetical protein